MEENTKEYLISSENTIFVKDKILFINEIEKKEIINPVQSAIQETRNYYKQFFSNHFENLAILTGAGTSIKIGKQSKTGKTRIELWQSVKQVIGEDKLKALCDKIKFIYPAKDEDSDIEKMLSQAYKAYEFLIDTIIGEKDLKIILKEIEKKIREECTLELPEENSPHEILLSKITIRKLKYPRVKLFTLNYDTLFEQAANKGRYTVIDGFSFTVPRTFSGLNYDYDVVVREKSRIKNEENYVPRVFQIYKLHGSLDWEKEGDQIKRNCHY